MWRYAVLGLVVLLPGCGTGIGTFVSDTAWGGGDPTAPIGDSENLRRVHAAPTDVPPLTVEPGDVWPGPPPPEPSLIDIQRETAPLPGPQLAPGTPGPLERGHPVPGSSLAPGVAPQSGVAPAPVPGVPSRSSTAIPPVPVPSPTGAAHNPYGKGILVPNGNGTSTLVAPDGSVTTVPTPK
jgi:hypothetical protein